MVGFHALSDRVLILKIASKSFNLVIIQVYAPTSTRSDEDIEQFYNDLDSAHKKAESQDMTILGSRNERGDIWIDWCTTHGQVITNTWFQHHNRHLYTW